MINVSSGVIIQLPSGGVTVKSIAQAGGTLDDNGGTISGPVSLSGSTLNLTSGDGPAQFTFYGGGTLGGPISSGQTIMVVGGGNGYGSSTLTLAAGSSNVGTILVQSANGSGYTSNLSVASGSTFTNAGNVTVNSSNNASSLTGGGFDNKGTLTVSAAATLDAGTAGATFTQDLGGTLTANGTFVCDAGTLLVNGGAVGGNVYAEGCSLKLAGTITLPTTVIAVAGNGNTTLVSNDATLGTVWVEGMNGYGSSTLTLASGANNVGTILVQSANGSGYTSNLSVASGSTFTNAGNVTVNSSNNASSLTGGGFDNKGTLTVSAAATLDAGTAGATFTQEAGGTLSALGTFVCDAGTLLVNGGAVGGNVYAEGCSLKLAGTITAATTVYAVAGNGNTTLVSNDATLGTVWVEGMNGYGSSTLTLAAGSSNVGTILVQSANGSGYTSNLSVASGSTFTNAGNVTVKSSNNASSLTGGGFDNKGTLTVSAAATLDAGTAGATFTQEAGGTLSALGTFVCDAGTLLVNGGAVGGNVYAEGCSLKLAGTITLPTTVIAVAGNGNTTLVSNDATLGTVWVEGMNGYGSSTLTLAAGSSNVGTILVQSANGSGYTSNLSVASGSTFTNAGNVTVKSSNNASSLTGGGFDNKGTLTVSAAATLDAGTAGATFTQEAGGTLSALGTFVCDAGTLLVNGGAVGGNVYAEGCSLKLAGTITLPTTVIAVAGNGNTTLVSNDATLGTVWVEGMNGYGSSTLTLASGANNVGTILVQSANGSGYTSNLSVASGSTFTNAGNVTVKSSNNASQITGSFDNKGTIAVNASATLDVGTAGVSFIQDLGGTLSAIGTFVCDAGTFLVNGGAVSGNVHAQGCSLQLAGTITSATTIYATGNTTLTGNASPLGTVWVQGNDNNGTATLTLPVGSNNLGMILLQSTSGSGYASNLSVASGSTFTNAGTVQFNLDNSPSILTGNFSNAGTLGIAGAKLTLAGSGTSLINLAGGLINASGTLNDSSTAFTNNGTLSIITGAAASLAISGTYTQTSTGSLNVELGGTTAGTLFDQLNVAGAAVLAGSVNVSLINGYTPSIGNAFKIMTFASTTTGMFSTYNGTNLLNGLILTPSQTPTAVTLTTGTAPQADLGVTVTAQPAYVTIGGLVTYTVTVTNYGPSNAQGVTLTDSLPSNASNFTITVTSGKYTTSGNVVTVNISSIIVGGTVILTLQDTPQAIGTYGDSASVASTLTYDSKPSNNNASASSTVVPLQADLAVKVAAQPTQVALGGNATYIVTVTNNGPNDAQGIVLVDTLPSNVSIVSIAASTGTPTTSGSTITLNLATLANAATVTLTIIVTPSMTGIYTDAATVTETSPVDPNLTNNAGSAFSTVVDVPASITATAGTPQSAVVGTTFATMMQATVDDQNGLALAGVIVTFTAPASGPGGSFSGFRTATATTNVFGVATAPMFTAGYSVGSYLVIATFAGVSSSAAFSLTNTVGAASSIVATAATPQGAVVNTAFATALQATVEDQYGNPIGGISVTFTAPATGPRGNFSGSRTATATTNPAGVALAPTFTAGTSVGSYLVIATVAGVSSSASFSLTNTVGAASSIVATAGTPQGAVVGTTFKTPLQATVEDQFGNPVGGVTVTFAAPASGASGSFAGGKSATAMTTSLGVATAPTFTAGTLAGNYSVIATVSGVSQSASFSLTNTAGAASSIVATGGTPQSSVVNTAFKTPLQATVEDQFGNPVGGVTVTFAAPTGGVGGNFAGSKMATATTSPLGVATAPAFTAGMLAGNYVVIGTVSGVSSTVSFILTNTAGAASSIVATAGTPQGAAVGTTFKTPLQATVEDQYGNPVGGVTVIFTAPASGVGGSFVSGKSATVMTTSLGVATAPAFTANTIIGSYMVVATVSGVSSSASFILTNITGVANIVSTAGTPQISVVNTAFTTALQATVKDQYGNPIAGVIVTFTAPASGPSGTFPGKTATTLIATATTNAQGVAIAPTFTANTIAGGFTVVATISSVSSSFSLTNKANTSTTLAFQPNPVPLGNSVIITATVAAVAPGVSRPTGLVSFFDGSKLLGSSTVDSSGHAAFTTSTLGYGTHSITATYAGDSYDLASGSTAVPLRVDGTLGDFDGDGKTDIALYDQTAATFYIQYSGGGNLALTFGNPAHKNIPVIGDFDGDGKTDIAIYDQTASEFFIKESSNGVTIALSYGNPTHANVPIAGDFDGDGKTDVAIYDQTAAVTYAQESAGGSIAFQFGNPTHVNIPVAADFDGDGRTDIAIYDQTAARFYIDESSGTNFSVQYGNSTHVNVPVAGDFDGDGKTDIAIYDQTAATYYIQYSGGGGRSQSYGPGTDVNIPIAGDFDGDGKADLAIYDTALGEFFVQESGGGNIALPYGNKKHVNIPI